MDHVISGVAKFQREVFPKNKEVFHKLANGQNPEVLFITCADSRIDPNLVTQTGPGDLFICRNAGNIVPPHNNHTGGMTASIEFAVAALGVAHIIVCGHSDCGAMKGALDLDKLDSLPHVREWLSHCRSATEVIKEKCGCIDESHLDQLTEENVLQQLNHLRTHPAVASKVATKQVQLHGWIYNIETGQVTCYDKEKDEFLPLADVYGAKPFTKNEV